MQMDGTLSKKAKQQGSVKRFLIELKRDRALMLMGLWPFSTICIFSYLPMVGLVYAFQDVGLRSNIWENEWVGLKWFKQFVNSYYFPRLMRNTLVISIVSLIAGYIATILLALIVNEVKDGKFKRICQSCTYFPNFIGVTILVGIMTNMLDPQNGVINLALQKWFGMEPTNFFMKRDAFIPLYVLSGLWQGTGWGTVIYLGAISGIDPTLYEAASIDGCGRLRRIWHITLQGMKPVIITLVLLNIGNILDVGYTKILLMSTSVTNEVSEVISVFTYQRGLLKGNYGLGSAVGLFNSVINIIMLLLANRIAKKYSDTSLL